VIAIYHWLAISMANSRKPTYEVKHGASKNTVHREVDSSKHEVQPMKPKVP
jgi:hypothetical protein